MPTPKPHAAWHVFLAFLSLGLTSFGGPIAHLGYFRRAFVTQRQWLDETHFAHLLGLCQLLPGPASSQLGFAIGLHRAGWRGGLAAFAGFTLPSALLMFAFALWLPRGPWGGAVIHGLKLVAVVVVGQAMAGMWRNLIPDAPRRCIAVLVGAALLFWPQPWMSWLAVLLAAGLGLALRRDMSCGEVAVAPAARGSGSWALIGYALMLVASFAFIAHGPLWQRTTAALYQAGALVFGGGHVVLPLLKQSLVVPGLIDENSFLAGYGAAQAVPGPMFSLATFLGQRIAGWPGALAGLLAMFVPGLLLVVGVLPWWHRFAAHDRWRHAAAGVHAAVVGLLLAAFWNPVWIGAIHAPGDVGIVAIAWLAAWRWRLPAWAAVCWCVLAACALNALVPSY
ncbi:MULTISPECIES: chromate efflux transporter [Dyella]|uniref:Chromate efflux transporter n=2 Tax=Dyella TaxID=231454 RepID=A0A4R0YR09_9GAMM|nr:MULTISPECIES: chromate efflux transporter [Dyella]TBR36625.1 chromate efflux transporter [Dyella terrae]TCI08283.1 chromate efflux transporter [Dyella soli]